MQQPPPPPSREPDETIGPPSSRAEELFAFALLAILIWPVLSVMVVGGYGFLVWMYQLVFGPPGPPA